MTTERTQTLRIGILSFAHMHAHSYAAALAAHPNVEFIGIADPDSERGQAAAQTFGTTYYTSDAKLLAQQPDGVIVTSENISHRSLVEAAASAGVKAILCEKPLATTLEDARAMIDFCSARKAVLATAFPCRYSPAARRLKEQAASGALGELLAIRGTNHGQMPGGWFVDTALSGGGAVIDHTVHVADLNRWLFGIEAESVYAEIGSGFYHQEWDDTGFLTINYSGGVFATLDTSWSRLKSFPTWGDVTLQAVGTGGVIDASLFAQTLASYSSAGTLWPGWGSNADAGLVDDFVKLAAGSAAPDLATGEDGLAALAVALAAYESAKTGEPAAVRS